MTSPNEDPFVRSILSHMGENPDDERIDTSVPKVWFDEPGIQSIRRLQSGEDINQRLAEFDENPMLRAEYRSVTVPGGETTDYLVILLRGGV